MSEMGDAMRMKKHYIMLVSREGLELAIGTDDLDEVSRQYWFRKFVEPEAYYEPPRREPRRELPPAPAPMPAPAPIPEPVQQRAPSQGIPSSFIDINPNEMTDNIWNALTEDQKVAYSNKWAPGPAPGPNNTP